MSALAELEQAIHGAAADAGAAVVGLGRGWGRGSGVVIEENRVLTCAHNLRGAEASVVFADGRQAAGRIAGSDPEGDVAVLEVDTGGAPAIPWPEAGLSPGVGRPVLALANPGGRGLRVTPGFVSCAARTFRGPRGRRIAGAIEHTAPLPRGSSGGPLIDLEGRLLGINSVRVDGGLILALPADGDLRRRALTLSQGEELSRPRLGVAIAPPRVARRLRHAVGLPEQDGILVRAVEEDGPAARAGLQRGDLLIAAGGTTLDRVDHLYEALDRAKGELELKIVRGTVERTVTVGL